MFVVNNTEFVSAQVKAVHNQNQDHNYRSMIKRAFGKDPMICPIGQSELKLSYKLYRSKADIRYDDVIRRRELAERNSTNNNPNNHSKIIS